MEAAGVEPASEDPSIKTSTIIVGLFGVGRYPTCSLILTRTNTRKGQVAF